MVHDWNEHDDGEGVEVVEDIVRNTVRGQGGGLGIGSSTKTTIINLLNWEEEEDCASCHSTANIVNLR